MNLTHPDDPSLVIGTCVVTNAEVTCTAGTYFAGKDDFENFTMFFNMQAMEKTTETSLDFPINHSPNVVGVPLPNGGGIIGAPATNMPTKATKNGWVSSADPRLAEWQIFVPASVSPNGLVVTDVLGQGQTLNSPHIIHSSRTWDIDVAVWRTTEANPWNPANPWSNVTYLNTSQFTLTTNDGGASFTVNVPADPAVTMYALTYRTDVPAHLIKPANLTNEITGTNIDVSSEFSYNYTAGGTGSGNEVPDLLLRKTVVGDTTEASFTFQVACTRNGTPIAGSPFTRTVAAGATGRIDDITAGAECTVTETTSGADSVTYSHDGTTRSTPITVPIATSATNLVTVDITNTYLPELGGFSIEKVVDDVAGQLPPGAQFTVEYVVTSPEGVAADPQTLTVTPGGAPASVDGLLVGSTVELTEIELPELVGYSWDAPQFSENGFEVREGCSGGGGGGIGGGGFGRAAAADCGPVEVVLTNSYTQQLGGFSITKAFDDVDGLLPAGTTFTVQYVVTSPTGEVGAPVTLPVVAGGAPAVLTDLPVGSTIELTEIDMPELEGYSWNAPQFSENGVEISEACSGGGGGGGGGGLGRAATDCGPVEITLTNSYTQLFGGFSVTKAFDDVADLLPVGTEFTVQYVVTSPAGVEGDPQNLTVLAGGEPVAVTGIAAGSTVHFTEVDLPELDGYAWDTPAFSVNDIEIAADCPPEVPEMRRATACGPVEVTLTNSYTQLFGGFSVTKTVTGLPEAVALVGEKSFTVTYTVDGVAAAEPLAVTHGSTATVEGLPAGAVVELTEAVATRDDVTFGTPVFTVDGAQTSTITIGEGAVLAVALENPVAEVPEVPTPTPTPTVPAPTTPAPMAPTPSTKAPAVPTKPLAQTGADGVTAGAFGALGLLLVGGALLAVRRRRAEG